MFLVLNSHPVFGKQFKKGVTTNSWEQEKEESSFGSKAFKRI